MNKQILIIMGAGVLLIVLTAAVTLVDVKSKVIVTKWENAGPPPRECDPTISRRRSEPMPPPIDGSEPNFVSGLLQLEAFQRPGVVNTTRS